MIRTAICLLLLAAAARGDDRNDETLGTVRLKAQMRPYGIYDVRNGWRPRFYIYFTTQNLEQEYAIELVPNATNPLILEGDLRAGQLRAMFSEAPKLKWAWYPSVRITGTIWYHHFYPPNIRRYLHNAINPFNYLASPGPLSDLSALKIGKKRVFEFSIQCRDDTCRDDISQMDLEIEATGLK